MTDSQIELLLTIVAKTKRANTAVFCSPGPVTGVPPELSVISPSDDLDQLLIRNLVYVFTAKPSSPHGLWINAGIKGLQAAGKLADEIHRGGIRASAESENKAASGDTEEPATSSKGFVFIGHGRSADWRELALFLKDRLNLEYLEFNSESTAGMSTVERLSDMLAQASFAFLVMTAEDQHSDGTYRARENVIHEAGLFQGKLGFRRAIVLLEQGCNEFSNIHGLTHIPFTKGNIAAAFEKIRHVLERENLLANVYRNNGQP